MKNRKTQTQIEKILNQILSNELSNVEISQKCRIISQKRDELGLDPSDNIFDVFVVIDSELDDFPPIQPSYDIDKYYLNNSISEINQYIDLMKQQVIASSSKLIEKIRSE